MKRDQLPPSLTFLLLSRLRKGGFLISSVRYPTPPPLRYSRRCSYAPRLRSLYRPTRSIVRCYSPLLESSLYRCRANLPTYLPIYLPTYLPTYLSTLQPQTTYPPPRVRPSPSFLLDTDYVGVSFAARATSGAPCCSQSE